MPKMHNFSVKNFDRMLLHKKNLLELTIQTVFGVEYLSTDGKAPKKEHNSISGRSIILGLSHTGNKPYETPTV
jgi:hypothetical protein